MGQHSKKTVALPWENKREDKPTEIFNLRFTEVEMEKLRFISDNTFQSMQQFVKEILLPAIDQKIDSILREKK